MLPDPFFIVIAIITLGSGIALFLSKRLLHSVIGLTIAFMGSAMFFIYLGQDLIALLQLFIFVGGLSTYLIVAVAAEESVASTKLLNFIILAAVLTIGLSEVLIGPSAGIQLQENSFTALVSSSLTAYYPMLFVLAMLLFGTVIGSILVIKKFIRLVV